MRAWTALAASHLDPSFLAPQRKPRSLSLQALTAGDRLGQHFTRASACIFGAGFVDFASPFGRVGKDQDLIAGDLQESTTHRHRFLGTSALNADDAWLKGRQQRRVSRQDP
jgi:hypothetical protein